MKPSYELEKIVNAFRQRAFEAERECNELRVLTEQDGRIITNLNEVVDGLYVRIHKAEAEIARRDAAAGEPVGFAVSDETCKWSIDFCGKTHHLTHGASLYTAATPAVLLQSDIDRIVPAIDPNGLDEAKHYIEHALYVDRERIRSELKDLRAHQQKVVELPAPEKDGGTDWQGDITAGCVNRMRDKCIAALDAANILYEVKK